MLILMQNTALNVQVSRKAQAWPLWREVVHSLGPTELTLLQGKPGYKLPPCHVGSFRQQSSWRKARKWWEDLPAKAEAGIFSGQTEASDTCKERSKAHFCQNACVCLSVCMHACIYMCV